MMSRNRQRLIAWTLAFAATFFGWQQALIFKIPPPIKLAIWFPSIVLFDAHGDGTMILLSLIQFPLLAVAFSFGINLWSTRSVLATIVAIYVAAVGSALAVK